MVLSWSRWMVLRFGIDIRIGSLLAHQESALSALGGVPRMLLYDNLKSAVAQLIGDAIVFNETLLLRGSSSDRSRGRRRAPSTPVRLSRRSVASRR